MVFIFISGCVGYSSAGVLDAGFYSYGSRTIGTQIDDS